MVTLPTNMTIASFSKKKVEAALDCSYWMTVPSDSQSIPNDDGSTSTVSDWGLTALSV
jgi:hypothetical protein